MSTLECLPLSVVWDPESRGTGTWASVDESYSSPTDADYISLGVPNSGVFVRQLFRFDASSIPPGAIINSVTIKVRGKSTAVDLGGEGKGSYWGSLAIDGNWYQTAEYHDGNLTTHSVAWTTNPDTGLAWTRNDIASIGSNPLTSFGIMGIPWPSEEGYGWTPPGGK
jgi:hypothetical protein